jgi:diguanylate cyclase (GGDEF)-like protein
VSERHPATFDDAPHPVGLYSAGPGPGGPSIDTDLLDDGPRHPLALFAYAIGVSLTAVVLWVVVLLVQGSHVAWLSLDMTSCYLFAVLLLVGELRPLLLARSDGGTDGITVSTTFSMALVLVGPLSLAIFVQALAVAVDDVWNRRAVLKVAFNGGQYVLTLAVARGVFCLLSGHGYLDPMTTLRPNDLFAAIVAGLAFFAVNNGAVAVAVALAVGSSAIDGFRSDIRAQVLTSGILIGLAPVAAVAAEFSLFMLPLLVLPLVGVRHHAWIATLRQHESLHDGLTGLPNRALFRLRADKVVTTAASAGTVPGNVAVMLLDLDHFKEVNDTLGHHVGDGLLRMVAERVTAAVPPSVTVARLGGDEFAVLVTSCDAATVIRMAERIAARLREPVVADGVRLGVQASIGIAFSGDHDATTDTLLQRADIALYRAKTNRGEIQVYRPEIDQHTVQRLSLLGDLHSAVDNHEFEMVYQPQVDTGTGQVVAVEALMRWNHPSHGLVSPDMFIPLAENTGLIRAMSRSAMEAALTTLGALRVRGHELSMAVNVSARLLSDLEMPEWIAHLLLDARVPSTSLTIEVTESSITADPTRAMKVLADLREIGVRLSIDDFGTGYSSLSYLRRLKPDELKIDRSFVMQMLTDENSGVIVRSTVDLGHGLGLSLVGEGVEDEATYRALAALGCDRVQGYHIARPMSAAALQPWLELAPTHDWSMPSSTVARRQLGLTPVPAPRSLRGDRRRAAWS